MNKNIYAAIAALSIVAGANAEQVRFSELPSKAQKTINHNLNGGVVQEIDRKTEAGRTIYQVEVRREGKNRHLKVDADGKLLAASNAGASVDVSTDNGGVLDKNDGKILDVFPAPSKKDSPKVESEVKVETDHDKGVKADVDVDTDKGTSAEVNTGEGKGIFRKGDGKVLGIPVPGRKADKDADVSVEVDANKDHVTTDVNGGLDTDKNDGRILGVPKRGFETLSLNEVPPVVRETIRREAGGYKIAEIEKATLNNRTVYEVDIERDGKNRELHVAADGTILKDTDREAIGAPAATERGQNRK
jgi:uncharacterized membrane protein YkoI